MEKKPPPEPKKPRVPTMENSISQSRHDVKSRLVSFKVLFIFLAGVILGVPIGFFTGEQLGRNVNVTETSEINSQAETTNDSATQVNSSGYIIAEDGGKNLVAKELPFIKTEGPRGKEGWDNRFFDESEYFMFIQEPPSEYAEYPEEVAGPNEFDELHLIRCTQSLICLPPYDNCTFEQEGGTGRPFVYNDPDFMNIVKSMANTLDLPEKESPYIFNYCETLLDLPKIIRAHTSGGGGGAGSSDYIGLINNGSVNQTIKIYDNERPLPAYYACENFLQLTSDMQLHIQCIGGEDGGVKDIYEVDLNTLESKLLLSCEKTLGDDHQYTAVECTP